jgi:hypothetical protein
MNRSKAIIKSFIAEADDNQAKLDSIKAKRIQFQDKADALSSQASKEYKANGHTKKFHQLSIDAIKMKIQATKTQQAWYKEKGGASDSPASKILITSLANYADDIKYHQDKMKDANEKFHEAIDGEYLKKWDALSDKAQKLLNQANAEDDKNGATKKHFQLRAESKKAHIEQDKVMIAYLKSLDGDKSRQIAHYEEQIKKLEAQVKEEMKRASEAEK